MTQVPTRPTQILTGLATLRLVVSIGFGLALLGGLALFVLGEVFAAGVRLRDDLEGTV